MFEFSPSAERLFKFIQKHNCNFALKRDYALHSFACAMFHVISSLCFWGKRCMPPLEKTFTYQVEDVINQVSWNSKMGGGPKFVNGVE